MNPNTPSPPPQSFEERISRVRLWTLIPVVFVPIVVGAYFCDRRGLSEVASQHVNDALLWTFALGWWLLNAAPRPYSVRKTFGRPLDLGGWGLVALALFGVSCVRIIWWLALYCRDLPRVASIGGSYSFSLTGPDPTDLFKLFCAVVLAPIIEELVFRCTVFRKWRVRWGAGKAMLLTSVIFGAFHGEGVAAFLMGLTCALAYTRTRSLWAAIVFHSLNNGTVYAMGGLHYFWDTPRLKLDSPLKFGLFALLLLVGVGVCVQFVVRSWRTLGDPLPPDSLQAAPVVSPSSLPQPLHAGG